MLRHLVAGLAGAFFVLSMGHCSEAEPREGRRYPEAPRSETVDDYHGTKVADPYRPLEDPDSPETRAWVEAENKITTAFLDAIPAREAIKKRLTELWNYEKFGVPFREGDRIFYTRNSGLQNQSVLYTIASPDAEPRVLLDPNTLSSDGTVALTGTSVSDDGALLAYGLATAGSDWQEWRVRDVVTNRDRDDLLKWIKFSAASWTKDNRGFYYSRFPEPKPGEDLKGVNYDQRLSFHRLGTPQADDVLVYERPDHKEWEFLGRVTDDGKYLIVTVAKGTDDKYRILYMPVDDPDARLVELIDNFDHEYSFLDNDGPVFWFKTDRDAPRRRVIAIDTRSPKPEQWKEVIPQKEETLGDVNVVGDRFIASYLKDAHTQVKVFALDGTFVHEIDLPGLGTATGFSGKRSDRETFYTFASFNMPPTVYRYDVATGKSSVFRKPRLAFDPDDYETTQVFFRSKDGTRIPMFISHKKGIARDGKTPTLLYGYGGFNIPLTPAFSASNLVWMEMGGIYAQPNLRGGGEYGEAWHKAGTKLTKQNVFDDFIAAAEELDRAEIHHDGEAGHRGRLQRRPAGGSLHDAAPRPLRRGPAGSGGDGHAPVPQVHDRMGLGRRLRLVRRPRAVQDPARLFAPASAQAGDLLPTDPDHHGRPRRPRHPGAQLQVRRGASGGPVVRQPGPDPDRDPRRPRGRQADDQDHRGGCRPLGLPVQGPRLPAARPPTVS